MTTALLVALAALGPLGVPEDHPVPAVRVVAAEPAWEPLARQLARDAPALVGRVARQLDLPPPPEMLVVVAGEPPRTAAGERALGLSGVPPWAAGIAEAGSGRIVLFAREARTYPHRDTDGLLAHEATHVLLESSVPRGVRIPRWYHEGLALAVERATSLEDALELAWSLAWSRPLPLLALDEDWPAGEADARAAYAQALSMVAMAERHAPPGATRRLVIRLRAGDPFDRAFTSAYGLDPEVLASLWYREARWRYLLRPAFWAALSFNGLLGAIGLVAVLVATVRRRRRMAEWAERERLETVDYEGQPPSTPPPVTPA
ncbi:MAG: hypothetical protein MUC67_11380 [Acidobacteria bacterium]|nr:hypothetical protein [Acidobacteriota bacterium]